MSREIVGVVDCAVTLIAAANGATRILLLIAVNYSLLTVYFLRTTPGGFSSCPDGEGFQPVGPSLSGIGVRITRPSQRVVYGSGRIIEKELVVSTGNQGRQQTLYGKPLKYQRTFALTFLAVCRCECVGRGNPGRG